MSHLDEYQTTKMKELFNIEVIEDTLEQLDSMTAQQRAVLEFIVNNPDKQYIKLQNTFRMPDHLVMDLVLDYGTPSEEYEKIRELKRKARD